MQLGLDEDDSVEELLDDLLLRALVRSADLGPLRLGVFVDRSLYGLRVAGVLHTSTKGDGMAQREHWKWRAGACTAAERTESSNALNSCSFAFLYASISFAASERASFSLWTRSTGRVVNYLGGHEPPGRAGTVHTLAGLLDDLRGVLLGL